jgi:hypothetical protein
MKLCYVILTCGKYIQTRCEWQKNTWLKNVDKDENSTYYYLCSKENTNKENTNNNHHYLHLDTFDTYESCPYKYIEFFKTMDVSSYDWIVFCDDDSYMFHNRVKNELLKYDQTQNILIGGINIIASQEYNFTIMSGGAGFIISSALNKKLKEYVYNNKSPYINLYSDVTICQWITTINDVQVINLADKLRSHPPHFYNRTDIIPTSISFHYVTEEICNELINHDN